MKESFKKIGGIVGTILAFALVAVVGLLNEVEVYDTPVEPTLAIEQPQTQVVEEEPEITLNAYEILDLVNKEREKVGVKPLIMDKRLIDSAQAKANEMFAENHYGHKNLSGRLTAYDIPKYMSECLRFSENLLALPKTSEKAVEDWMNSTPHRKALLDPVYEYTGIASKTTYTVQHFCDTN